MTLVDFGYKKHFRVHHSKNEFARGKSHINGIESVWGYAKTRLVNLKGIDNSMLCYALKNVSLGLIIESKIYIKSCLIILEKSCLTSHDCFISSNFVSKVYKLNSVFNQCKIWLKIIKIKAKTNAI